MRREIAVSAGGRDIAGLRRQRDSVVFYSGDHGFRVHITAHNPNPARGFLSGGLRTTHEPAAEAEPAAAIFVGLVNGDTLERHLDDLGRAVSLGTLIAHTDDENLLLYRESRRSASRLTLPPGAAYTISAWLVRASELYEAQTGETKWALLDTNGPTWMALFVE